MEAEIILDKLKKIIVETGDLLIKRQQAPLQLTNKGFRDIVTDADYAAQTHLTTEIQRSFPTHGFITEEDDSTLPSAGEIMWIIDPIDGTTNFSRKMPTFSISVAAGYPTEDGLELFLGAVYDPRNDEFFHAIKGQGAYCNDVPIYATPASDPIDAVLAVDWSREQGDRQKLIDLIAEIAHDVKTLRSIGTAALALAYIAAGRLEAYCHVSLMLWDMAAGILLVKEAGGEITDFHGTAWDSSKTSILATNGKLHPFFARRIREIMD